MELSSPESSAYVGNAEALRAAALSSLSQKRPERLGSSGTARIGSEGNLEALGTHPATLAIPPPAYANDHDHDSSRLRSETPPNTNTSAKKVSTPPSVHKQLIDNRPRTIAALENESKAILRSNYLNMCKIGIKTLIESSIGYGKPLNEDHSTMRQLLSLIEIIIRDGFKQKKTVLGNSKDVWPFIEAAEKWSSIINEMTQVARSCPTKTYIGKLRAYIRICLVNKCIADQLKQLIDYPQISDWYEPTAFLMNEEGIVVTGMLNSISSIDCRFDLQEFYLDHYPTGVVDLSPFFKEGNYLRSAIQHNDEEDDRFSEANFAALNDQKVLLDEMNRNLRKNITDCAKELELLQNKLNLSEVALSKRDALIIAISDIVPKYHQETLKIDNNKTPFERTRLILESFIKFLQNEIEKERSALSLAQNELSPLLTAKRNLEQKVAALEKRVTEQQDALAILRTQLSESRATTQALTAQNKANATEIETLRLSLSKSEQSNALASTEIANLKKNIKDGEVSKSRIEATLLEVTTKLREIDAHRSKLLDDLKSETQFRIKVQQDLQQEKQLTAQIGIAKAEVDQAHREYDQLMARHILIQGKCKEQEKTLLEMADAMVKQTKLLHDYEEREKIAKSQVWEDDSAATDCKACNKPFNVSRRFVLIFMIKMEMSKKAFEILYNLFQCYRKHHCRHCGGIFCNDCSNIKMPLPSSAKPVRVCAECQHDLLAKLAAQ